MPPKGPMLAIASIGGYKIHKLIKKIVMFISLDVVFIMLSFYVDAASRRIDEESGGTPLLPMYRLLRQPLLPGDFRLCFQYELKANRMERILLQTIHTCQQKCV
jgi:hypothetical protein